MPESSCTHSETQSCSEFGLIQRLTPPYPVWIMWKVIFDLQFLQGIAVNSYSFTHISSNMLEDLFESWIDITLRDCHLCEGERKTWTLASEIAEKLKYRTQVFHTSSISASTSSSSGLNKKCTTWAHSVGVQSNNMCSVSDPPPILTFRASLLYHRYLVLACFSENTLRMKLPFLWGLKVEGMMAYSPGGSLKRLQTSRVLMKSLLMATGRCRSRTSGPRWTFLRPLSWRKEVTNM